jgi:hypothetical protein
MTEPAGSVAEWRAKCHAPARIDGSPGVDRLIEVKVEPNEIFELIVKADEKLKYATTGKQDVRRHQARELLEQARAEAVEIGNDALVRQADTRLADLEQV